jgi:hypothetical protein
MLSVVSCQRTVLRSQGVRDRPCHGGAESIVCHLFRQELWLGDGLERIERVREVPRACAGPSLFQGSMPRQASARRWVAVKRRQVRIMVPAYQERLLWEVVRRARSASGPEASQEERRQAPRHPWNSPVTVTPVDDTSGRIMAEHAIAALGTDISPQRFSCCARHLLGTRRALVTLWFEGQPWCHLLFEPRWVRFLASGTYQMGGKLLRLLPRDSYTPPAPPTWEEPASAEAS